MTAGHHLSLFVEKRPICKTVVQNNVVENDWNKFEVRATPEYLGHHRLVFNGVNAAGGIHQYATRYQQRSAPKGDVHLHLEHLSTFFWCPIPPDVAVFSRGRRTCTRHIGHNDVKSRRRQPCKMTTIVLGHHDIGEAQSASIAHQHVHTTRNGFIGHHDAVGMQLLSQLCGL